MHSPLQQLFPIFPKNRQGDPAYVSTASYHDRQQANQQVLASALPMGTLSHFL
jgi:hypothetical protein